MSKFIGFAATVACLCSGISIAAAADDGKWVTCRDGLQMHSGAECSNHGGMVIPLSTSTPIDTTKGVAPNKTAAKKALPQKNASIAAKKKIVSKRTSTPTGKCMDGAMYFSTERRGACAKHGGVRTWY